MRADKAQPSTSVPHAYGPKPMNPLTSFLVFAFFVAAFAVGYFVNPYVAIALFAATLLIAWSHKMAKLMAGPCRINSRRRRQCRSQSAGVSTWV